MRDRQIADREAGQKAQQLQQALDGHFEALAQRYTRDWREGATTEAREAAWQRVKALDDLRDQLRIAVENGRVAERQLNKK